MSKIKPLSLWVLTLAVALTGCGKGLMTRPNVIQDPVNVPLQFTVSSPYFLTDTKKEIYDAIRDGESVAFGDITHALIQDHLRIWREKHPEDEQELDEKIRLLQTLASGLPSADLGETKAALEKKLTELRKEPVIYNAQASTIFDYYYTGRQQAFSGTSLLNIAVRETWGKAQIENGHLVVIYESGSVLPGYIVEKDGQRHLFGVETSVGGKGTVVYGKLEDAVASRMLRILDADLYAIVELFKFEADDILSLANQALILTAEHYGLVNHFEFIERADYSYEDYLADRYAKNPLLVKSRFRREADNGKITWSPLNFGNPDISRIDRTRAEFDSKARTELPRANPNLTIFHQAPPAPAPTSESGTSESWADPIPPYPYRQTGGNKNPVFQCWDYQQGKWIDIPTQKNGNKYVVLIHPCAASRPQYEDLPDPLIRRQMPEEPEWDEDDGWDYWD